MLEVEGEALLVPVDAEEVHALVADEWRPPLARIVAAARMFDLDHACTHVGEHQGAVGAGHDTCQVQDRDSGQNAGGHARHLI